MSTVYDHTCLVTRVRNASGVARFFPFLPPHGRKLDIDEEISFVGTIGEALSRHTRNATRKIKGFLAALDSGSLEIVYTPRPLLQDATTDATKALSLDNGTLGAEDPCWLTSLSED